MQYFQALKMGQKRVEASRAYLNSISNDRAMPALALRDNKTNVWEPVGEENLYAVIDESSGFNSKVISMSSETLKFSFTHKINSPIKLASINDGVPPPK